MSTREMFVYFDHLSSKTSVLLGVLSAQMIRGKELFSFAFDSEFLNQGMYSLLDPDLQFYTGRQFTNKTNFGLFMDSAPDRWGRKLMQRREALLAKSIGENPKKTDGIGLPAWGL